MKVINGIKNSYAHSYHESNKRESNSSFTDFFPALSTTDLENQVNLQNQKKNSKNIVQVSGSRGSQIIKHSNFMRDNNRNKTYCSPSKKKSFSNLNPLNNKQSIEESFPDKLKKSLSLDEKPANLPEKKKVQIGRLLKNNILKEYEHRLRYFLKNEKFFLSGTNNMKINIPFAYLVQPPPLNSMNKIKMTQKEKNLLEYKSLTDRKYHHNKSQSKTHFINEKIKKND